MGTTHTYHSPGGEGEEEVGSNNADRGDGETIQRRDRLVRESSTVMDEAGGGSIGLAVGPVRGEDKCNYPEPQA
jgi:hypothetical protein